MTLSLGVSLPDRFLIRLLESMENIMSDLTSSLRLQHYDQPAMDRAHHRMTALLGAFPRASEEALRNLLHQLMQTASDHFDQEERFMLATDYDDYETHRAEHQHFISMLTRFKQEIELGKTPNKLSLYEQLCSWQDEHQQSWDDPLAQHLRHTTCWKDS